VSRISLAILAAALWLAASFTAHAAGLGRITVLSPLGQPLNAEIELVSLQPGEEDALTARLAPSEAFRQAGIEPSPALSGVRFTVVKRDGRSVIRVTSPQPVNEPFLDLLVELEWPGGRLVREYTLLLDPPEYKGPQAIAAAPPVANRRFRKRRSRSRCRPWRRSPKRSLPRQGPSLRRSLRRPRPRRSRRQKRRRRKKRPRKRPRRRRMK
jgi:pilus assembly protein FimV